jgi:two-component system KDP operon response regulator KdpE
VVKKRILLVDDEIGIIKFVRAKLVAQGYDVLTAMDGIQAFQTVEMELPDLIVLDIMMPKMDGFEVCSRIREWSQIPIIMLSARCDETDKVKCLELGADDYITKPFGAKELIARVSAVLRRTTATSVKPTQPSIENGDLEINFALRRVTLAGKEIQLTPTEYSLLQELSLNAGRVLTHNHLLKKVWGPEYGNETDYLHTFIRRLRRKLEPDSPEPLYIVSVPGVGYRFRN